MLQKNIMRKHLPIGLGYLVMGLLAFPASAALNTYFAETLVSAKKQGAVQVGNLKWQCIGTRCTISGPWPNPGVGACQALAQEVGAIKSYGHANKQLTSAELQQCNVGLTAAPANTADSKPKTPTEQKGGQAPEGAVPQSSRGARPAAEGATLGSTGPFAPRTIRTAALRLTGTGATAAIGSGFAPLTLRTQRLTLTGTGATAAVGAGFTPRSLRTAPLTITGTGGL